MQGVGAGREGPCRRPLPYGGRIRRGSKLDTWRPRGESCVPDGSTTAARVETNGL